jgi:hypothetical protein
MVKNMVAFFPNCGPPSGAMSILAALISLVMVFTTLTGLDSDARIAEIHEIGNLFTENYQYSFFPSLGRAGGKTTSQEQSINAKEENPGLFHYGNQSMARSSNSENGPKKVIDVISPKNEQISHEICSSNGHDGFSNTQNDLPLPITRSVLVRQARKNIFPKLDLRIFQTKKQMFLQWDAAGHCRTYLSLPVITFHRQLPPFATIRQQSPPITTNHHQSLPITSNHHQSPKSSPVQNSREISQLLSETSQLQRVGSRTAWFPRNWAQTAAQAAQQWTKIVCTLTISAFGPRKKPYAWIVLFYMTVPMISGMPTSPGSCSSQENTENASRFEGASDCCTGDHEEMEFRNFVAGHVRNFLEAGTAPSDPAQAAYVNAIQYAYSRLPSFPSTADNITTALLATPESTASLRQAMTDVQLNGLIIHDAEEYSPPSPPPETESKLIVRPTGRPFLPSNINQHVEECRQTYLAGAQPLNSSKKFDPNDSAHVKHVDKLLRAALWIRFLLENIPGPGMAVTRHDLCSLKDEDLSQTAIEKSNSSAIGTSAHLPVTVSGFPLAVTAEQLEDRMRDIGAPPVTLSIAMATRERKYREAAHSTDPNARLITTAWATMQIPNSVRSWQLLSGIITAFYEAGHGALNGHMMGFRVEHWTEVGNIIRLNTTSDGPRMTLPSVMNAVGFQQEQWNRFLTYTLRQQGLPALWARMSDCAPKQPNQPTQLYPWFGYHGTIDVFLPSKTAYAAALANKKTYTVTLKHLLYMLPPTQRTTVLEQSSTTEADLEQFPLALHLISPFRSSDSASIHSWSTLISDEELPRTVVVYPTAAQKGYIEKVHGRTPESIQRVMLAAAQNWAIPLLKVTLSYFADTRAWAWSDGIALVMKTEASATKCQGKLSSKGKHWHPASAIDKPKSAPYHEERYKSALASSIRKTPTPSSHAGDKRKEAPTPHPSARWGSGGRGGKHVSIRPASEPLGKPAPTPLPASATALVPITHTAATSALEIHTSTEVAVIPPVLPPLTSNRARLNQQADAIARMQKQLDAQDAKQDQILALLANMAPHQPLASSATAQTSAPDGGSPPSTSNSTTVAASDTQGTHTAAETTVPSTQDRRITRSRSATPSPAPQMQPSSTASAPPNRHSHVRAAEPEARQK